MTRRASLPGVDELFRSSKDPAPEAHPEARVATADVVAPSRQVTKEVSSPEVLPVATPASGQVPAPVPAQAEPVPAQAEPVTAEVVGASPPQVPAPAPPPEPDESRRPRHDEKVTFYCTGSDLTRIERARLTLRAEHKLASDRGRIVRAALAEILEDFERRGADSALVARLRARDASTDK